MESPSFAPSSPATPLHPASPDRINRLPDIQSPSTPLRTPLKSPRLKDDPFFSQSHRNSDVQGKVLQFNQLADALSPKRKDNEAALRRAVLGREEAESRMRRLEEENTQLQLAVEEGRGREMKVAQRIETMMEEVQRHKEAGQRANTVYEKEIRRARKEAFKSSSSLVQLQDELKNTRNRYTLMREEVEVQKRKLESTEQDAFTAQYNLVGVQEELETLQHRLKLAEEERDTLRTSLKEEEIARIAAEGKIPLPPSALDDEFSSPKKPSASPIRVRRGSDKENMSPIGPDPKEEQIEELLRELAGERRRHQDTHNLVDFMKLECQLHACSCRRAEQTGGSYIHDESLSLLYTHPTPVLAQGLPTPADIEELVTPVEESVIIRRPGASAEPETLIEFSPATGTFRKSKSPAKPMMSISDAMELGPAPIFSNPLQEITPPSVSTLAPPALAPTEASDSPSVLSLPSPGGEDRDVNSPPPPPAEKHSPDTTATPMSPQPTHAHPPPRPQSRAHSRVGSRAGSRVRSRISNREIIPRSQSRQSGHRAGTASRAASPPREQQNRGRTMRLVENSRTTKVPLVDAETPCSPQQADRPRMPFTPKAPAKGGAGEGDNGSMPFTPGATKTRAEALQSIRRWREANSKTGGDGQARARARSVTQGSMTPRRPSPARRDITK